MTVAAMPQLDSLPHLGRFISNRYMDNAFKISGLADDCIGEVPMTPSYITTAEGIELKQGKVCKLVANSTSC